MQALTTNESLSSSEGLGTALFRLAFVLAIGFVGFVAGSYAMFAEAPPARYLADAYRGGQALLAKKTQYDSPYPAGFWQKARTEQRGVVTYDPARATNGHTLYTSGEGQRAVLVSMTGEVLHEWNLPFSAIWDETASVQKPRARRDDPLQQGLSLPQRRSPGDLRGARRHALGLWPRQDGQGFAPDLEVPGACPSRSRRRAGRQHLSPYSRDQPYDRRSMASI